jgi:hypothetical protein
VERAQELGDADDLLARGSLRERRAGLNPLEEERAAGLVGAEEIWRRAAAPETECQDLPPRRRPGAVELEDGTRSVRCPHREAARHEPAGEVALDLELPCQPVLLDASGKLIEPVPPAAAEIVRNVPAPEKFAVEREYRLAPRRYGRTLEIDHIVSLELGGSNAIANLFPDKTHAHPGYKAKDRLENALHAIVCRGAMRLRTAQRRIAANWRRLYTQVFGVPPTH